MSLPWSFIFRSSSSSTPSPKSKLLCQYQIRVFSKKIKEENGIILETDLYKSPSRTQDLGWFDKRSNHFPQSRRSVFYFQVTFSLYDVLIFSGEIEVGLWDLFPSQTAKPRRQPVSLVARKSMRNCDIWTIMRKQLVAQAPVRAKRRGCSGFIQHFCSTVYACRMFGT